MAKFQIDQLHRLGFLLIFALIVFPKIEFTDGRQIEAMKGQDKFSSVTKGTENRIFARKVMEEIHQQKWTSRGDQKDDAKRPDGHSPGIGHSIGNAN